MSGRNRGLAKGEAWAPRNGRGGKWRREPSQVLPGKDGGPGWQKEERLARQEREAEATVAENRATVPCGRSPRPRPMVDAALPLRVSLPLQPRRCPPAPQRALPAPDRSGRDAWVEAGADARQWGLTALGCGV